MSVYLSVHNVKTISASTTGTSAAPITIECMVGSGITPHAITLFTGDPVLNERLIEAINKIRRTRLEELAGAECARDNNDDAFFEDEEERS